MGTVFFESPNGRAYRSERGRLGVSGNSDFLHDLAAEVERLQAVIHKMRTAIEEIVCTEGCDKGVVMLSHEGPTHYDAEAKCQVYDHEYFSPLGDALIALHDLTAAPESPHA